MPTYEIKSPDGRVFEVTAPDGASQADVLAYAQTNFSGGESAQKAAPPAPLQSKTKIDPDNLQYDRDWLNASRTWYRTSNGKDFQGSDKDLAEEGISAMSWFNNFTPAMGYDAAKVASASPEQKKAFLYLLDTYDKTENTWGGFFNAAGKQIVDPVNWATAVTSLFTGGGTAVASQGAKTLTKEGLKELLKKGVKVGVAAGVENAVIAGGQSAIKQQAKVNAGGQDEISFGQVAEDAAIGGAAGFVLGTGAGTGVAKLTNNKAVAKAGREAAEVIARDAIRAAEREVAGAAPPNVSTVAPEASPAVDTPMAATRVAPEAVDAPSPAATGEQLDLFNIPADNANPLPASVAPNEAPISPLANPVDNIANEVPTGETPPAAKLDADSIIKAINDVSADSGARLLYTAKDELAAATKGAADLLKGLGINTARDAVEVIRRTAFTTEGTQALKDTVMRAAADLSRTFADAIDNGNIDPAVLDQLDEVQNIVTQFDLALSSASGRDLGNRAGGLITGDMRATSTTADMVREMNLDPTNPEHVGQARQALANQIRDKTEEIARSAEVRSLESKVAQAFADGDIDTAIAASDELKALEKVAMERKVAELPFGTKARKFINELMNGVATVAISNLLSAASLVRNIIGPIAKTIYKPILNTHMKGWSKAARAEMATTYHTLWRVKGDAMRQAITYFRYGQDLLTHSPDKLLEMGPAIPGRIGRVQINDIVSIFPKLMGATDQFLRTAHYRAFIEGDIMRSSMEEAARQGLSNKQTDNLVRKALTDFFGGAEKADVQRGIVSQSGGDAQAAQKAIAVLDKADNALKASYDNNVDSVHVIDFLREQGVRRGYTGEALDHFIRAELSKNADQFKQAANQTGINYVNDLLFSRTFSGEGKGVSGSVSKLAKSYGDHIHTNPFAKIFLNPFFLTPVRVFEEGIRLTPLAQLLAPKFLSDLKGARGPSYQIRAQGEFLLSQALVMEMMFKYAKGEITSGGPTDPKERKAWEDKGNKPYTIDMFGTKVSYRNYDPFATPFKILTNAMDRYRVLEMKVAQGEYEDKAAYELVMAHIGVATGAIGQAIQDSNLLEGIAQAHEAGQAFMDPAAEEGWLMKFAMSKIKMAVPSTFTNVRRQADEELNNPLTAEQHIKGIVNPASDSIPSQYDAMGMPRKSGLGWWSMIGIDIVKTDADTRGLSPMQAKVNEELGDIAIATGKTFALPTKSRFFPGADLRTEMTADGKQTLQDRFADIYRSLPVTESLHAIVTVPGLTIGTYSQDGTKTIAVSKAVSGFQEAAGSMLFAQEAKVQQRFVDKQFNKADVMLGSGEQAVLPY